MLSNAQLALLLSHPSTIAGTALLALVNTELLEAQPDPLSVTQQQGAVLSMPLVGLQQDGLWYFADNIKYGRGDGLCRGLPCLGQQAL